MNARYVVLRAPKYFLGNNFPNSELVVSFLYGSIANLKFSFEKFFTSVQNLNLRSSHFMFIGAREIFQASS